MKLNKIIDDYVVSDQIQTEDIQSLKIKDSKLFFVIGLTMRKPTK